MHFCLHFPGDWGNQVVSEAHVVSAGPLASLPCVILKHSGTKPLAYCVLPLPGVVVLGEAMSPCQNGSLFPLPWSLASLIFLLSSSELHSLTMALPRRCAVQRVAPNSSSSLRAYRKPALSWVWIPVHHKTQILITLEKSNKIWCKKESSHCNQEDSASDIKVLKQLEIFPF